MSDPVSPGITIRAVDYSQFKGEPNEWILEGLTLGPINLVVGKNASGKTRVLNIIAGLGKLLSGESKMEYLSGSYDVTFSQGKESLKYILEYKAKKITREIFERDGVRFLDRGEGGVGSILAEKIGKHIEFQTPENELAAVARRDSIQHPFFEPLYAWGNSIHRYDFGTSLGRDHMAVLSKNKQIEVDPKDPSRVVGIYRKGAQDFGDTFKQAIIKDMSAIGYALEDIAVRAPHSLIVPPGVPGELVGISVKETTLRDYTDQTDISQGMFRALSIIIQLNYSELALKPSCILIDDIGEGLDFERSSSLIELLMNKAKQKSVQLVMATNDRFIMNKVSLDTWTVLRRESGKVKVHNYSNSKAIFDEFKFTGMNNFDFFAFDFIKVEQQKGE